MSISNSYYLMCQDVNSSFPDMNSYDEEGFYAKTSVDEVRSVAVNFDHFRQKDFFLADVHFSYSNVSAVTELLAKKLILLDLPKINIFKANYGDVLERTGELYYSMESRYSLNAFDFSDGKGLLKINQYFADLSLQERLIFTDEKFDKTTFVHQSVVDIFMEGGFSGAVFIPLSSWRGDIRACYQMVREHHLAVVRPAAEFIPLVKEECDLNFNELIVDIKDPRSVAALLMTLTKHAQAFYEYFVQEDFDEIEIAIGSVIDGEFVSLIEQTPEDQQFEDTTDESVLFEVACADSCNQELVLNFVNQCIFWIEKNGQVNVGEEFPLGLVPTFSLAWADKKYIELFLHYLTLIDMNHESYEGSYISCLYDKWGPCDEMLPLLAARSTYLAGQYGTSHDNFVIPDDKVEAFFYLLVNGIDRAGYEEFSEEIFQYYKIPVCMVAFERSDDPVYQDVIKS